jgi:hypothetical protein
MTPADRPTYTDPNALSLDGACEATGIAYDHDMPWSYPHRWRPARKADACQS